MSQDGYRVIGTKSINEIVRLSSGFDFEFNPIYSQIQLGRKIFDSNYLANFLENSNLQNWPANRDIEFFNEYIAGDNFPQRIYDPYVGDLFYEVEIIAFFQNDVQVGEPILTGTIIPESLYYKWRFQGYIYYEITLDNEELFGDKDFYIKIIDYADGLGDILTRIDKIPKSKNDFNIDPPVIPKKFFYSSLTPNPVYGSNVLFKSRLNYLQTIDNSLKILPSSENNLISQFNFKFLLDEQNLGNLLKKIEIAAGYKNLEFNDPSNMYKDIIGLVENYSLNKNNQLLNEANITVNVYSKAPIFNWKTSSFLNIKNNLEYSSFANYKKYDFVYFDPEKYDSSYKGEKNKIDNFWFAKEDIVATEDSKFNVKKWTKIFNHDSKLPFDLNNKLDFYQMDYKNSYIQNIKYKENPNSLKQFQFKIENITDSQCRSILFFFEKKCGYRRFIYKFPFILSDYKTFICTEWNHVFKYYNCNDITATFIEDPNVNSNNFKFIDYDYYDSNSLNQPYPEFLTSL